MIIPDVNLLIYAHHQEARLHRAALAWWQILIEGNQLVALPWAVTFGFIRVATSPAILKEPLRPAVAIDIVESWLEQPNVQILEPGPRHLEIVHRLFEATGVGGNLTTDTHLAALALEFQCELHSNDNDFARFPGLRWNNPLR